MDAILRGLECNYFSIVEGITDWIRVIGADNKVLYTNKKMREDIGRDLSGEKCYSLFGQSDKCKLCTSCIALKTGNPEMKEVEFNSKVYNVVSSPIRNSKNEMVAAVEVFRDITNAKELTKELNSKNKTMLDDIKFAQNIQDRMLPLRGLYNGLMLDYIYKPSEMLSGDMFDIYKINDRYAGLYICDVVGHGVSASLLTMFVRQSLRTLGRNQCDPEKIMKELHKMFLSLNLDADKYFSVFFGIYDRLSREFNYVNAGHNTSPLLISNNKVTLLEARGYPICNIFEFVDYDISKVKLKLNDKLLLYTDGIIEARNKAKEEFGENKIIKIAENANDILQDIYSELKNFSYGNLEDDCAMMLLEVLD
jgi:sigma-B regulation protein RsbU (phosphoserine phosphatase)